jgi:DNA-binding transcriptional LysR family regulator
MTPVARPTGRTTPSSSRSVLLDLVVHGLGVAVVPEHIARKKAAELPCVPLPMDAPRWDVTISIPTATTAVGRAFLAPLRDRSGA